MKKIFKISAIIIVLLVIAAAVFGNGSSDSEPDKKISSVNTGTSATKETDGGAATEVAIDEQVLFDSNDIKITATGMEDGLFGTELKLSIENNSSQGITVQANKANVNGYMVTTIMSAEVAAGKKTNDSLTFETSGLKECGIESIATMEFSFHIFDTESWEDIVDTDMIKIETEAAGSYTQTYDDSGEVLVDTNGVKIVGKGLSTDDSFWGPGVILYIENNTNEDVTIQVRDVSINGTMVDSTMSEDVVAGKKAISAVQFFSTDLEENSITDIKDVELYFHIFNMDSWDTIFDSDVISIKF